MMPLPAKHKQCQRGYTLVELMVAVALTAIVTMAIYKAYVSVSAAYDVQDQVIEIQQSARVAMDRMIREVRMAGYDPGEVGGAGIDASSTSQQIVFSRYDDDAAAMETITYSWDGTDLNRNGQSVITNVDALNFVYLAITGAVAASPGVARGVIVTVVVRASNEDYGYTNSDSYTIELPGLPPKQRCTRRPVTIFGGG